MAGTSPNVAGRNLAGPAVLVLFLTLLGLGPAQAQWVTQPILLKPGWNAVYLEVQPEPRLCDDVLAGLPVESLWFWNRRFDPVQFIQDPASLEPSDPDWLVWFPPASPSRAAASLQYLLGGRACLIKLAEDASPTIWNVKGTPSLRRIHWLTDSLNLVGFGVSAQNPPTFASHFDGAPAHDGQPIYFLNASGLWEEIQFPEGATLERGQAYWVASQGSSDFTGPIALGLDQSTGLDFGRTLAEQTVRLRNVSAVARSLSVRLLPSAEPPAGPYAPKAGDVFLSYFRMNLALGQYSWVPLAGTLEKLDLMPGEEWSLRLQVRRADMAASENPEAVYQSLLEISDDYGTRWVVPVTAQGAQSPTALGTGGAEPPILPHRHAGLWLGSATVGLVSQPSHPSQPDTPQPVSSEFAMRLIVHVDATGQARLLQKVIQMWRNGTTQPDPLDPANQIVDEPGRYVLLTDESLVADYTGAALRDGRPVGRRVSSAAFGFKDPILFNASGDFGQGTFTAAVFMAHDDPLNPFMHRYHPDHDNLDERYESALTPGVESFDISRDVSLIFSPVQPDGWELPGWGDTQLGGTYRETIRGVHQRPVYIEGYFRLQRASTVPTLNDQN